MKVYFDIKYIYYFPQYLPVWLELNKIDAQSVFVVREQEQAINQAIDNYLSKLNLNYIWVKDTENATQVYLNDKPDWIIFGHSFQNVEQLHKNSKTVIMQHGIGPKGYFDSSRTNSTVRFVEGEYRLKKLKQLYPENNFVDTGFAKLDSCINSTENELTLIDLKLDPNKKTILYAPTYYPSSIECLPKNWPELLSNYNLIIKPHFFSLFKAKHDSHRDVFSKWASYSNVYMATLDDVSIVPFYKVSDLLISDASSTLLEFTALNKPAIWTDFYKLRWSYRGPFKFRLKNKVDEEINLFKQVSQQTTSMDQLQTEIKKHISHPEIFENARIKFSELLVGKVDGKVSERIVNYLQRHK